MYRFSMFDCLEDIKKHKEYYVEEIKNERLIALKEELSSQTNEFFNLQYLHGCSDQQILASHAAVQINEFLDDLIPFL